jgi:hypothetical protein
MDDSVSKFFEMEKKHSLFGLKTKEGFFAWDIFRFYIFYKYTFPEMVTTIAPSGFTFKKIVKGLLIALTHLPSLINRKSNVIIFPYSRYLDTDSKLYDKVSQDTIDTLQNNAIIIEELKPLSEYKNKIEYNYCSLFSKFYKSKPLNRSTFDFISKALISTYGEINCSYEELNQIYSEFQKEYCFYRFLFLLKKPKIIFYVQRNQVRKGMIAAAKLYGIKTLEFQHGIFGVDHPAYSYYKGVDNQSIYFSDYFLTMGSLWGANVNVPAKVVVLGNNEFAISEINVEPDNSLLFISSLIHRDEMVNLAIKTAKAAPMVKINYKLHPNEYVDFDKYVESFKQYENIQVLCGEQNLKILIKQSQLVVLIASTCLFEALNMGRKVAIYKKQNYETHQEQFNLNNVFLFDDVKDLLSITNQVTDPSPQVFFEPFNKSVMDQILKENEVY